MWFLLSSNVRKPLVLAFWYFYQGTLIFQNKYKSKCLKIMSAFKIPFPIITYRQGMAKWYKVVSFCLNVVKEQIN